MCNSTNVYKQFWPEYCWLVISHTEATWRVFYSLFLTLRVPKKRCCLVRSTLINSIFVLNSVRVSNSPERNGPCILTWVKQLSTWGVGCLYTGYKMSAVLWFLRLLCLLLHFFPLFHLHFTSRDLRPFGPGSPFSPFIPLSPEEPFSPFKPNQINQIIRLFWYKFKLTHRLYVHPSASLKIDFTSTADRRHFITY